MTGSGDRLTEAAYVASFGAEANIAVGDETPWGIAAELERILPGTGSDTYTAQTTGAVDAILAAAGERRIVAVVRDEHRYAWMGAALDALLAARPDTVVVEMGLPQSDPRARCMSPPTARQGYAARQQRSADGHEVLT